MTNEFEKNIADVWGELGSKWLQKLPSQRAELAKDWGFEEIAAFPNLTYSYVAQVQTSLQRRAILKMTPPCERTALETAWYLYQNGVGCPRLYRSSKEQGVLLLEELSPAITAKSHVENGKDNLATKAIAEAFLGLDHRPQGSTIFPHIRNFLSSLRELRGKVSDAILDRSIFLLEEKTKDPSRDVVLHGDLHHDNVLLHKGKWVAIDPHGYTGPVGFEIGCMMRNPYDAFPKENLNRVIESRLNTLTKNLPLSTIDVIDWSVIYTMIATAWSLENHNEVPDDHINIVTALLEMRKKCS